MVATAAYLTLLAGYSVRRSARTAHVALSCAAILTDIALVLTLQIQRNAVQTALAFKLSPLQQLHILFSTLALVLYFPTLYLGFRLYLGRAAGARSRLLHVRVATTALVFRSLGFAFMFSLLFKKT